jgi:iron-sulfur cluster assembly accessory protein
MTTPPFAVSPRAEDEVRRALGKLVDRPVDAGLRVEVVDGDCAGHQFRLAFDVPGVDDVVVAVGDVTAFVSRESLPYLEGATVDFLEYEDAFAVNGAPVVSACGCGNAFKLRGG